MDIKEWLKRIGMEQHAESFAENEVGVARAIDGGMGQKEADGLIGLFRLIRDGSMAEVTDDVELVTGRAPIGLSAFARDYAEALCRQL